MNAISRFNLAVRYLRNDRCSEYAWIIEAALEAGYRVATVRDSIGLLEDGCSKLLTLRHDIDAVSPGTRAMFAIEREFCVTASYYFRRSTLDVRFARELETYGSEASFHYEVIADYAKARNLQTREALLGTPYKEDCLRLLWAELERFRVLTGAACVTIASHGDSLNRLLETPNNVLAEDTHTYETLGIRLEAYNERFLAAYDDYISDTVIEINGGYRYGHSPLRAMERGKQRILFLTHPNHWKYDLKGRVRKVIKSIVSDPITLHEEFRRI